MKFLKKMLRIIVFIPMSFIFLLGFLAYLVGEEKLQADLWKRYQDDMEKKK